MTAAEAERGRAGTGAAAAAGPELYRGRAGAGAAAWQWLHLGLSEAVESALLADEALPNEAVWALLEEDTQPRARRIDGTVLLILRGINELLGAEPEDMISLRLAIAPGRVVSLERRRLGQVDRMIQAFEAGDPPETPGRFVLTLIEGLREAAEPVLDRLEAQVVRLERQAIELEGRLPPEDRTLLPNLRQDIILIHRYTAPQATALHQLVRLDPPWLVERGTIEEEAESFLRIAADLDALRARAQVVAEQVSLAAAERTNRIVMLLSVVSAVFLPLTFLTGLLGVNLGGIPGAESPAAFTIFGAVLAVVAVVSLLAAIRLVR